MSTVSSLEERPDAATASSGKGLPAGALTLLLVTYALCCIDRQIVTILAEPIKQEFGLKDRHLGLLTGFAFAVFYTTLAIPVATLAERTGRARVIAGSLALWSGFTAACGLAGGFLQLLVARVGVGVGEAGCTPAAHSLITERFPAERRASAMAYYMLGAPLGALLGLGFGGVIAQAWGWRAAFLVVGLPGMLLAPLVYLRLRVAENGRSAAAVRPPAFWASVQILLRSRCYLTILTGLTLAAVVAHSQGAFLAVFLIRAHADRWIALAPGLGATSLVGLSMGLLLGLFSPLGMLLGGRLADRGGGRAFEWGMFVAAGSALAAPCFVAALLVDDGLIALALLAPAFFLTSLWTGPVYAAVSGFALPGGRAVATALALFVSNLVGLGFAPLTLGSLSDWLATGMGEVNGLRWALVVVSVLGVAPACFFLIAGRLREVVAP